MTNGASPARCARNSVWPGKSNPLSRKTAFSIGPVTIAAPEWRKQYSAAARMQRITASAVALEGAPQRTGSLTICAGSGFQQDRASPDGSGVETCRIGICRPSSPARALSQGNGAQTQQSRNASAPACHARRMQSGPMPAGSPGVIRMEAFANARGCRLSGSFGIRCGRGPSGRPTSAASDPAFPCSAGYCGFHPCARQRNPDQYGVWRPRE